ncbi:hypothetical protein Tco_0044384 [Tanacetum coccineum]
MNIKFRGGLLGLKDFKMILRVTTAQMFRADVTWIPLPEEVSIVSYKLSTAELPLIEDFPLLHKDKDYSESKTLSLIVSLDLSKVTITLQAKALDPSFGIQQIVGAFGMIGDGALVSIWYDRWCPQSPLADVITSRDIFSEGFNHSTKVWSYLKDFAGLPNSGHSIDDILDDIIPFAKRKTLKSIIAKLVVAAIAYFIWQERNSRLLKNVRRTVTQVIDCIMNSMRLKLLSCHLKKTKGALELIRTEEAKRSKQGKKLGQATLGKRLTLSEVLYIRVIEQQNMQKAEEEAREQAHKAAEEESKKKADEEAAKAQAKNEETMKKAAEVDAIKKVAEQEAKATEQEAKKKADEEAAKAKADEEVAIKKATKEEAKAEAKNVRS